MPDTYTSRDLARWYQLGIQHERERAAGAEHEAAVAWGRTAEQISRDRRGELLRLFRSCAERTAERAGRTYREYRGGPVDWETGRPVTA